MTVLKLGESLKTFFTNLNANFLEISGKLTHSPVSVKQIYSGSATIRAKEDGTSVTITANTNITQFDGLIFIREDSDASIIIRKPSIGTIFKPVNQQADYTQMFEGMNLFMCNAEIISNTQIKLSSNVYSGVGASGTPVAVFRANGSNYERVIAGLEVQGGYAVITASEAFAGYVRCI